MIFFIKSNNMKANVELVSALFWRFIFEKCKWRSLHRCAQKKTSFIIVRQAHFKTQFKLILGIKVHFSAGNQKFARNLSVSIGILCILVISTVW